ncbi:MAG: S-layer homology domain-containing protein [Candidatus Gracilibacteria bacterium]|nr:S-layer homology domain-containing protein [Candidatus Gracilibacteria bacterium]
MKKLLSILGGGCGGGKKILALLMVAVMMATMAPMVFADVAPEYQEFGYNDETHWLATENLLNSAVEAALEADFYFFFRTNPAFSGDTDDYLYGYGYGIFAGEDGLEPGYGYGFGYGYDYFNSFAGEWMEGSEYDKFGIGLGESYGEFKLLATDGETEALPVAITLEAAAGFDASVSLPAGLVMTGGEGWDGTINVEEGTASDEFEEGAVVVTIDKGDYDGDIYLTAPVLVKVPYSGFDGGLVKVYIGVAEYEVSACTTDQFTGDEGEEGDLSEYDSTGAYITSLNIDDEAHCYTYDDDYVYVATTHFTDFAAGAGGASDDDDDDSPAGGGSSGGSYKKAAVVAEGTPEKVSEFKDLLTLVTSDWRYAVVQQMLDLGLFQGKTVNGERVFDMEGNMTRGMAATVICRYMGCDEKAVVTTPSFMDVPNDAYYAAAVSYLKDNGIVQGKTPANFDPAGTVTRAQFFKMVVEAYMKLNPAVVAEWNTLLAGTTTYFDDVPTTVWYAGYMNLAANKGLLKGAVENGKRYAKGGKDVTRVQAGAMIGYVLGL